MSDTETSQGIRRRLFDALALGLTVVLVPVVVLAWVRAGDLGDAGSIAVLVHTSTLTAVLGAFLLRRWVAFETRATVVLCAGFASGATSVLMRGMQSSGALLLCVVVVLAATFGTRRTVYGFLIAAALFLFGVTAAVGLDLYDFPGDAPDANTRTLGWVSLSWTILAVSAGTAWLLVQLITGLHERIEALERARLEAVDLERRLLHSQKLEAIGTLAGGVAHDFRNFLVPIQGHTELLLMGRPPDKQREPLQAILAAARGAQELCGQILSFARQEEHQSVDFPLVPLLKESTRILHASVPPGVTLSVDWRGPRVSLYGDPSSLRQVILNLCSNAVHAVEDGGSRIDVVLEATPLAEVPADGEPGRTWVRLRVSDDGVGIPEEHRERIFEPYYTTKPKGKGTGLGLAMVQGEVRELGGRIRVRARTGGGAEFLVDFPGMLRGGEQTAETPQGALPRGQGQVVVVVDDDRLVRKVMGALLRELGYEARVYGSPTVALEALEADASRVAAVITDLSMPGLSGDELARRLRARHPELPIALMTGHSLEDVSMDLPSLRKPLAVADVADLLGQLVATGG